VRQEKLVRDRGESWMMYNKKHCHDQTNRCSGRLQATIQNSFERTSGAMYFGNEHLIDSIVDKYRMIADSSAKLVDGEEANLADSTLSYVRNFLKLTGFLA
jgi:hypothetical protein